MFVVFMKRVIRPWGNFKQFVLNKKCTVKILSVSPGQRLSLQKHKRRREMWYFLTGGFAQIGKKILKYNRGDSVRIGKNKAHRLISRGKEVEVLEISFGNFDEGDEVILEDDYGRV